MTMNELKERLEKNLLTKTFNISGVPFAVWNEINAFCIEVYGDSRWVMVKDLVNNAKNDYKYGLLVDEIDALKAEVALLKQESKDKSKESKSSGFTTFGM